jgi:hypothetical protein
MTIEKPRSFQAFWPIYLRAHSDPACRRLHFIGSSGAAAGIAGAIILRQPLFFVAGMAFAYLLAWVGHFAIEKNRPATFGNPLWSLMGDIRMYGLWLAGRLEPALREAGALPPAP